MGDYKNIEKKLNNKTNSKKSDIIKDRNKTKFSFKNFLFKGIVNISFLCFIFVMVFLTAYYVLPSLGSYTSYFAYMTLIQKHIKLTNDVFNQIFFTGPYFFVSLLIAMAEWSFIKHLNIRRANYLNGRKVFLSDCEK